MMSPPVVLTFESRCKYLSDRLWSGCIPTYDQFAREMKDVVASAPVRPGQLQDAAYSRCLKTFEVIEYIRQRALLSLAIGSTQAATWAQWSERVERDAVAGLGYGKDAGRPGTGPSPASTPVPDEKPHAADAPDGAEGFWI